MTCADALLAVLPLEHHTGPDEPIYARAAQAVEDFFKCQITYSDILAFRAILRDHKDHTRLIATVACSGREASP
jgi:hypothetical protein